jgi:hypothetical protein
MVPYAIGGSVAGAIILTATGFVAFRWWKHRKANEAETGPENTYVLVQ